MKGNPSATCRLLMCLIFACTFIVQRSPGEEPTATDQRLAWWTDARFGMFIHWGLYAVPAGVWGDRTDYGEWIRSSAKIPLQEYEKLLAKFNPTKFDADSIVLAARNAGMKYIVITTKHHDGFCLFDSAQTDWDVMSTPFKRDIMKEMADACRRHGLRIGWYYSIMDWHHPDYTPRRDWEKGRPTDGADFDRYVAYMKAQLKELLTNYGDIGVLWFDGQWEHNWNDERGRDLYAYVRSLQPGIIINSRVGRAGGDWGIDRESGMIGDYGTPEQAIPADAITDVPWETCMTMNGHWGYNEADKGFKTTQDLVRKLADIAGKGGNFLLNVGPTSAGEIPPASVERLTEIGGWMKYNEESIRGTGASPFQKLPWGTCTTKALPSDASGPRTRLFLHVFEWPGDQVLSVPGLLNSPIGASVLGPGGLRPATAQRRGDDVRVQTGSAPPNEIDSVIALDISGDPDVAMPPTIVAPAAIFTDSLDVTLASPRKGVVIRYTLDGSAPTPASPSGDAVVLRDSGTIRAACFRDDRPVSPAASAQFRRMTPVPALKADAAALSAGLTYTYHEGEFKRVAEMSDSNKAAAGTLPSIDISSHKSPSNWGFRFDGFIRIPADGVYRFFTSSDDGSTLSIGDTLLVDNDEPHSFRERHGDTALAAGLHPIKVMFFENTGGYDLKVQWQGPGFAKQAIPAAALFHVGGAK